MLLIPILVGIREVSFISAMGSQCKHHSQVPGDGVCPSCLQKKLKSVRWGETSCSVVAEKAPTVIPAGTISKHKSSIDPIPPKEAIAILGSIASIKNRNHRGCKPGRDITEAGLDFVLDSRYSDGITSFRKPLQFDHTSRAAGDSRVAMPGFMCPPLKIISRNADHRDADHGTVKRWSKVSKSKPTPTVSGMAVVPGKSLASADSKSGSPLVDRVAKETALRVIKEVKDDISDEGEAADVVLGNVKPEQEKVKTLFSPSHWQSKMRSKWGLKGIGSPMITSSNKVFPSKSVENVQKLLQAHFSPGRDQSRVNITAAQEQASDRQLAVAAQPEVNTQEKVIVGMPDRILKPEDMNQRLRASYNTVLQWLEVKFLDPNFQICDQRYLPFLHPENLIQLQRFTFAQ